MPKDEFWRYNIIKNIMDSIPKKISDLFTNMYLEVPLLAGLSVMTTPLLRNSPNDFDIDSDHKPILQNKCKQY